MALRRLLAVFVLLLSSAFSNAASVSERSPFAQGLWWDPARAGTGFEMFSNAGQAMVIWYTFDKSGRPVWYTAQGSLDTMGAGDWPLLKYRWTNGRKGEPAVAGSLRVNTQNPESATIRWQVEGESGAFQVQPFVASAVLGETDHSGAWYDPANPGWGLSLLERGDVLGGVLYAYDASGEPTWLAGFERGGTSAGVALYANTGSCPSCAYRANAVTLAGRLAFDFTDEKTLRLRTSLGAGWAAGTNIDGASLVQLGRPASLREADRALASFDTEAAFKAFLASGVYGYTRSTGIDFSPAPPSTFSATNIQEAGVDEADVMKSNGRYIYTFEAGPYGAPRAAVRIARVDNDGATLQARATVELSAGNPAYISRSGLYLDDGKLVVLTGGSSSSFNVPYQGSAPYGMMEVTRVEIFGLENPESPVSRWRADIEGTLVSSRRIGSRLYLVSRYFPFVPNFIYGATTPAAMLANQQLIASTPLAAFLPRVRVGEGAAEPLVTPATLFSPPPGTRRPVANMVVVTAIDLAAPRIAQSLAIVGYGEAVYASPSSLFVATSRYDTLDLSGQPLAMLPSFFVTDIHQVRLGADAIGLAGSASIEGALDENPDKAAFRLSDSQGRLRVVTSHPSMWGSSSANRLTVLEPSTRTPGLLRTVSVLPNANRPETLGKPYEMLYSTRFVGERLYAVTFKKVDPLYVVDLGDGTDPRIAGALEIPGFSDYLHPLPGGLLLGFGKDAKPAATSADGQWAWYQGLQLSLYDVSNAGAPREVRRVLLGKRGSDSALLRDHHAFSTLQRPDGSLAIGIPVRIHDGTLPQYGSGDSASYPWKESGVARFEVRAPAGAEPSLTALTPMVTHTPRTTTGTFYDPGSSNGRSILFPAGTVYVGNGQFWRQDAAGNVFGPY